MLEKPLVARNNWRGAMVVVRSSIFLLLLNLLQGSNASFIQLNNNGYEGIIIAISPGVPENEMLIEKIKVRKKWDLLLEF